MTKYYKRSFLANLIPILTTYILLFGATGDTGAGKIYVWFTLPIWAILYLPYLKLKESSKHSISNKLIIYAPSLITYLLGIILTVIYDGEIDTFLKAFLILILPTFLFNINVDFNLNIGKESKLKEICYANASAVAFWNAWHNCDHSLLPLLVTHGANPADALYSYLYESYASLDMTKKAFVSALIVASNYEQETLRYAASFALEHGFDDITQECINCLSDFPEEINDLFDIALIYGATQFYPVFMSLNAVPQIHDYHDEDRLSYFIINCSDRKIIEYLALHVIRSVAPVS